MKHCVIGIFLLVTGLAPGGLGQARAAETTNSAPRISVGQGYYATLPNKLLLVSEITGDNPAPLDCAWSKASGPAEVVFERSRSPITWVKATVPGRYVFKIRATAGNFSSEATTAVNVYDAPGHFGNPILPGMFPDPHILYDNDRFYIFATSMENEAGAYGRASVWSSKDFVTWEMRLTDWPVYGKFGGDIWAPDILTKNGKYYQFITRSGGYDTWIGVADRPFGPWRNLREDNTPIVSGGGKAGRIVAAYNMDSNPFVDDDGQVYMYWGWSESMAARLTPDLKNIDGEVHFLKGTKWLPDGGQLPQWLAVDLGEVLPITRVVTSPEFRKVPYGYKIELSEDNAAWATFVDRSTNRTECSGDGYADIGEGRGRYVRITMNYCSGNWAGIYDFEVFSGGRLVSRGKPATASSVRGKGSEPGNAVDDSTGPYLNDFVEGSYLIKRNGIYYLLYSSGALHDGSYSVHYAMGKTPFGPFLTPADNVLLKSNDEKTTQGPGHNSVLKFGDAYYIVYHQHNQPHEGAGGVFRQTCADRLEFNADAGIKLYRSTDLRNWEYVKLLIDAARLDEDVWYKDRFWAPELHRFNNRYFLTFNCQNSGGGSYASAEMKHFHACGLAISDSIGGPYRVVTHEKPLTSFPSNDMSLFQDNDGRIFCFFNNGWTNLHHIYVAELDTVNYRLKEEPVLLISQEPGKWDGAGIEGAHVIRHDSTYYMFYSSWTRGYAVGYATSESVYGPWIKSSDNPLFGAFISNDSTFLFKEGKVCYAPDSPYRTVGHNQVFSGPDGSLWISCHGYGKDDENASMIMDPLWFENGKIKTNAPTYTPQVVMIDKKNELRYPGLVE